MKNTRKFSLKGLCNEDIVVMVNSVLKSALLSTFTTVFTQKNNFWRFLQAIKHWVKLDKSWPKPFKSSIQAYHVHPNHPLRKTTGNRFELHNWAIIFGIQMNYEGVTCNQAVLLCAFPEKRTPDCRLTKAWSFYPLKRWKVTWHRPFKLL